MSIAELYQGSVDRLKSEQGELSTKLQALEHFIARGAPGVSETHKLLLEAQHKAMALYHSIITMRLKDLEARYKSPVASTPELGEPKETGGHDQDRDGPVPFGG